MVIFNSYVKLPEGKRDEPPSALGSFFSHGSDHQGSASPRFGRRGSFKQGGMPDPSKKGGKMWISPSIVGYS